MAHRRSPGALCSVFSTQHSALSWLVVRGGRQHNLKNLDVPIPLGRFVCITGVSGSGKSSLVNDILWPALAVRLQNANLTVGEHDAIDGVEHLDKVINVDQSPIGVTPASNPATYTGVFDWIRELFARLPDAKLRGYTANRFSFNRPGGRCEACEGNGQRCIEMHFMPDVWVECETCRGRRYNPETLEVRFKGKTIADVLDLRVADALVLFENVPKVRRMLQTLADVGLDYVQLGQPAPTLSGGEAQRVKLATELGKPDTGRTFYILDEPTTGLHFDDIRKLLAVIHRLVDLGNTVLIVEHNLDVLKCADWIIDLGPDAGDAGGYIVAAGTPEGILDYGYSIWDSVSSPPATASTVPAVAHSPEAATASPAPAALDRSGALASAAVNAAEDASLKSKIQNPKSKMVSHTATALAPILGAGPYEERKPYDPAEHAARELAVEKAGLGDVGREVRLPWQLDGRKWHLEQRGTRADKPRHWEPAALEYVVELVQQEGARAAVAAGPRAGRLSEPRAPASDVAAGPRAGRPDVAAGLRAGRERSGPSADAPSSVNAFDPTNWNNRASVEITAPNAPYWFLHALTGGEWLLELYFRTPPGTFNWRDLDAQLKLKTLDEREDLQAYGDWARVDVRPRQDGWDAVVVYVHDKSEIDTPAFRRFIKRAVSAYVEGIS